MPNSVGKTKRDVMKYLRATGQKCDAANVERVGKEVRRTESENRQVERIHRERGLPALTDAKGRDMHKIVRRIVDRG